ncbi:MAG: phosphomannomutase/phosphoglucomutase [bacterium]|nr:phosphomannomutase/phosphoglucomutase [bacterium]
MDVKLKLKAFHPGVFHAYDVRGLWPEELDHNTLELITLGFKEYISRHSSSNLFLLGQDVRGSSSEILEEVKEVLLSRGADIIEVGTVTTPMFTFAMAQSQAAGGLMVTASHNSIRYNGLKIYEGTHALSETSGLNAIRHIIEEGLSSYGGPRGSFQKKDFLEAYRDFLVSKIKLPRRIKVVFDTGGGAVGVILPEVLGGLKMLEPNPLSLNLDSTLSLREPNPLLPSAQKNARQTLLAKKAEAGFIFDPDGDRVVVLDEKGETLRGDSVLWLLVSFAAGHGESVVYDIRSSHALREDLEERGIRGVPSRVGHSFIKDTMRDSDAVMGGELSGHFFFRDFFFAESALLTALKIIEIIASSKRPLSELIQPYLRYFHSGEINFAASDKTAILRAAEEKYRDGHKNYLDGLTVEYPFWWFNLRPSQTENLLRLVFEAKDKKTFDAKKEELSKLLMQLGASPA